MASIYLIQRRIQIREEQEKEYNERTAEFVKTKNEFENIMKNATFTEGYSSVKSSKEMQKSVKIIFAIIAVVMVLCFMSNIIYLIIAGYIFSLVFGFAAIYAAYKRQRAKMQTQLNSMEDLATLYERQSVEAVFLMDDYLKKADELYYAEEKAYKSAVKTAYQSGNTWATTDLKKWITDDFRSWFQKNNRSSNSIFAKNTWSFTVNAGGIISDTGSIFDFSSHNLMPLRTLAEQSGIAYYLAESMKTVINKNLPLQEANFEYNDNRIHFNL